MFRVQHALISYEVATAKFACNLFRCKGACCVVGEAGAPVKRKEVPAIKRAYEVVKDELRERSRQVIGEEGLVVTKNNKDLELSCTDGKECVFVTYDENDVAICSIQKAWMEGRFNWPKPLSCHLFPLRITTVAGTDYINFEYVPEICSPGCEHGESEGIYLSDFSREPLIRAYGQAWYDDFQYICQKIRQEEAQTV